MPSRSQACRNRRAVYSAALIGVHDHSGHLAAAYRDRHCQRAVGQLRARMLRQAEPEDPPRPHVQDRREVQLALAGGDLGAVAVPLAVDGGRSERPLDQVRRPPPALARPGRGPAAGLAPGGQAHLGHQHGDGVLADCPPGVPQRGGNPR
jgi:hypothetical protein